MKFHAYIIKSDTHYLGFDLIDLIERTFQREGSLFVLSSHLMQSEIIIYGLVRKCVKLSPFSWTIFILDLALNCIDRL